MPHFSIEQVHKIAADIVEKYGETYHYPYEEMCRYVDDNDAPFCFVGVILHRLGVPIPFLRGLDEGGEMGFLEAYNLGEIPLTMDLTAAYFLSDLQEKQDSNWYWSTALHHCEHKHNLI